MPSSKGYKRDYKSEYANYHASPAAKADRALRNKAHNMLESALGKNIKGDVDHKKPLAKGGKTTLSNLRAVPASKNRSFARTKTARMK